MRSRQRTPVTALLLIAATVLAACDTSSDQSGASQSRPTVTVSAAATESAGRQSPRPAARDDRRAGPDSPSPAEREQLPSCDGAAFRVAPVDLAQLSEITPLGNLAPPDHTTPTEHTYLHFADAQDRTTTVYPLFAPADITLLLVRSSDGFEDPEDYSIAFALCKDVYGYFNHVKFLSDEVSGLLAGIDCATYADQSTGHCERQLFESVPAGTVLGQVGRLQGNFDFGTLDIRVTHTFANADRYQSSRTPHIVCPYDYYEGDLKQELYALLSRTEEPRCGVATIDEPGTLQGVWFGPGSDVVVGWEKHLSFVPDNFDPRTSVIAVGGTFTEPGRVEFTPVSSGTVNRAFREVTADGTLYCYQRDGSGRHERVQNPDLLSGKILVLLVSAEELQVERQAGQCGAGDALSVPTTYFRWGVCAPRGETKLSGLRARPRFHRPSGRETADLRICVRSTRGPAQSRIGPRELSSDRAEPSRSRRAPAAPSARPTRRRPRRTVAPPRTRRSRTPPASERCAHRRARPPEASPESPRRTAAAPTADTGPTARDAPRRAARSVAREGALPPESETRHRVREAVLDSFSGGRAPAVIVTRVVPSRRLPASRPAARRPAPPESRRESPGRGSSRPRAGGCCGPLRRRRRRRAPRGRTGGAR